jgi:D-lactate dehydrogenase
MMGMGERPVMAFFEVETWEREVLSAALADADPRFFETPLRDEHLDQIAEAAVVSPFIYSALTADRVARLPALQLVTTRSTGFDHIDLAACAGRGVTVCNVPVYGENTVAEHTFGLILSLSRRIHEAVQRTRRGDFSLNGLQGFDLRGKVFGCVGAGMITPARGGLVDTDALLWALDEGLLAGAGLDVLEGEELVHEERQLLSAPGNEEKLRALVRSQILLRRDNVVFTPHIAFNSREALRRIVDTTIDNIRAFRAGEPQNVVGARED